MRAYLIDPEPRTITEIDFGGGCAAIDRIIGCEWFTTVTMLNGSLAKGFDTIYVSHDALNPERCWCQYDADPIAGKGVVVGFGPAGTKGYCDAHISLDELTRRIQFIRRKFRGVETSGFFAIIEEQ